MKQQDPVKEERDEELLRFYGLRPGAWRRIWEDPWSVTFARCVDKSIRISLRY